MIIPDTRRPAGNRTRSPFRVATWTVVITIALLFAVLLSLSVGARSVPIDEVWTSLLGGPATDDAALVTTLRVPRTLLGLAVGAALGAAGALIQAVSRNPLADPGILGVSSGAAFAVALAVGVFGATSPLGYTGFAVIGALAATVLVFLIGSAGSGSVNPARITLAGMALSAALLGITSAMILVDPRSFSVMNAWRAGILSDRDPEALAILWPLLVVGVLLALLLGRPLNAVALGEDLARAVGARTGIIRGLAVAAITLLAGVATALAGPIAFLGLMVPHVARRISGPDQRGVIALSMLLAPILLLGADVLGRVLMPTGEVPVGIVTAFLGAPVLIVIARGRMAGGL